MREDGARREKVIISVNGCIRVMRGKEFGDKGNLRRVFRNVSLDRELPFCRK